MEGEGGRVGRWEIEIEGETKGREVGIKGGMGVGEECKGEEIKWDPGIK